MWGIPHRGSGGAYVQRFIPTYAGHTPYNMTNKWAALCCPLALFDLALNQRLDIASHCHAPRLGQCLQLALHLLAHATLDSCIVQYSPPARQILHAISFCGSSPHTWGILFCGHLLRGFARFIPTYVGHTNVDASFWHGEPVHPHIRGAYGIYLSGIYSFCGSSPHTWGIPKNE